MTVGGLGQPGTRITRQLSPVSELLLYVWQAIIGAIALDVALALVMCSWLIVGWFAIPLVFAVAMFFVTIVLFTFFHVEGDKARFIVGNLWAIGLGIGIFLGMRWHDSVVGGMSAIAKQVGVIFALPWWVYALVGFVLVLIASKSWKASIVALLGAAIGYIAMVSSPRIWLTAWDALKWLLLPYLWPFIGFAVLLAIVMTKELLFPSLEWTFKPVSLEELREVGLFGLWMPNLLGGPKEAPPVAERIVKVETTTEKGKKFTTLPDTDEAREFYRALKRGEPFTERTAAKYGVVRSMFRKAIRDVFLDRGWACWKDDRYPQQGLDLLPEGWQQVEHIVMGDTTIPSPTDDD